MLYEFIIALSLYISVKLFIQYHKEQKISLLVGGTAVLFLFFNLWLNQYSKILSSFASTFGIVMNIIPVAIFALIYYIDSQRRKSVEYLSRYLDENVVRELMKKPIKLGGEKRVVAIIFTDVRGFTSMSEKLKPEEVVELLNGHFEIITRIVREEHGALLKFIGDAAMIAFNIPYEQEDFKERAYKTSARIIKEVRAFAEKIKDEKGLDFSIGIGVNVGEVVVGNIGSTMQMDYTVIGDAVNTASRLNGVAKSWEIALPKKLANELDIKGEEDSVKLKGKAKPLKIVKVEIE